MVLLDQETGGPHVRDRAASKLALASGRREFHRSLDPSTPSNLRIFENAGQTTIVRSVAPSDARGDRATKRQEAPGRELRFLSGLWPSPQMQDGLGGAVPRAWALRGHSVARLAMRR